MKANGNSYDRKGHYLQQAQSTESVAQGHKDENACTLKDRGKILSTHSGSGKAHSKFVLLFWKVQQV